MNAAASRIAQISIADTATTKVFTAVLPTEITRIMITGPSGVVDIYHNPADNTGNTPGDEYKIIRASVSGSNLLWKDEAQAPGTGITLSPGDELWVFGSMNEIVIAIYAITANIAPQQ